MRTLLLKTWRDIKARKGQFGALIALVAIGIMAYVAFLSAYLDLVASADRAITELAFADFQTTVLSAPASAARRIEKLPGVRAVEARLVVDAGIEWTDERTGPDGAKAKARVIGMAVDRIPSVNRLTLVSGRLPKPGERDAVVVNTKFANETGVGVGSTLELNAGRGKREIAVVGVGASPEYFYPISRKGEIPSPGDFAVIFAEQHSVEQWFSKPGGANDFAVLVEPGADTGDVIRGVEGVLDPYYVIDSVEREDQASNVMLHEEISQNEIMAEFLPPLVLVISSASLFIAMSRLVQSQRGEIGLAKALGYSDWQVLAHYLAFSVFIALGGSVIGIALGQWIAYWEAGLYVDMLGIPMLASTVHLDVIGSAVAMSTVACIAAGIFPAWNSARIAPANAMHSDPNVAVKGGRIPLVERALGWAMPRSFVFRIPLRNVFRSRRRTIYTILGIAFSMILTVSTWSMFDAVDFLMGKVFTQSERWDILAVYENRFGAERIAEVRRWKGVNKVDPALMLPAELQVGTSTYDGLVTSLSPRQGFHGFDVVAGADAEKVLAAGRVVMAQSVATAMGASVGDTVRMKSPYLGEDERRSYVIGAVADETLGGGVFVSPDIGRELLGVARNEYNALYIFADPNRADQISEDLYDLPGATQVQVKVDFMDKLMSYLGFMVTFVGVMLAFGFAMAAAVIYNTFTANILERTREIATMRTIGEDNAHLAWMVTIENVFLALVAVPLGVWLGVLAADAMYSSFSTEAYSFKAVIYPTTVAWIVVINLVVLLLSEIPPIRRIFRMDLAEATKVME